MIGAKNKSFTDLECALKQFQQNNYVQLYKRISRKLGTGSKYKNIEVAVLGSVSCTLRSTHTSEIYGLNRVYCKTSLSMHQILLE
jgi:hypothetical protein